MCNGTVMALWWRSFLSRGGFCREELVLWVRKQTGDAATTLTSKDEAATLLATNVRAVIGYFANFEVALTQIGSLCFALAAISRSLLLFLQV